MRKKKPQKIICPICREEIMYRAGPQKYHRQCSNALRFIRSRNKSIPNNQLYSEARGIVDKQKKDEQDRQLKKYSLGSCDPKCPGLTLVGGDKAYCMLPVCRGKGFWTV